MAKQVYLYIRFSTKKQEEGDSIRRQLEYAENVASKHGLTINDDLVIKDLGLSAFHADHLKKGELGKFVQAVDDGRVEKGSILIVESLDRLSRDVPLYAQMQFHELIRRDITVITANDGLVYNEATLAKDPSRLYTSIGTMVRAHDESLHKQKRSVKEIQGKINAFNKEDEFNPIGGGIPCWLNKEGKGYVLNDYANHVLFIIELYINNHGISSIVRILNERGILSPKNNATWGVTSIRKILDSPALIGTYKFKLRYLSEGKKVEEIHELKNYYPSLISEEKFLILSQRKRKTNNSRSSYGSVVHLLSSYGKGKAVCSKCGYTVRSQLQKQMNRKKEYTQTVLRLHCQKHKETLDCCKSFKAGQLEAAFIDSLSNFIKPEHLAPYVEDKFKKDNIEAKLSKNKDEIDAVLDTLLKSSDKYVLEKLQEKLRELEVEKSNLENELDGSQNYFDYVEAYEKLSELASKSLCISNFEERAVLKQVLMQAIDKIIIDFESESLEATLVNGNKLILEKRDGKSSYYRTVQYKDMPITRSEPQISPEEPSWINSSSKTNLQ